MQDGENILQPLWDYIYPYVSSPYHVPGIYFFIANAFCMIFLILDYIKTSDLRIGKWLKRFSHTPDYCPDLNFVITSALDNAIVNFLAVIFLSIMMNSYPMMREMVSKRAPTLNEFFLDVLMLTILWELVVWPLHKFQHCKHWYRLFHYRHHIGTPSSYSMMRSSFIDEMFSIFMVALPVIIWRPYALSFMIYNLYFVSFGVATHSGWKLPGCDFHYYHHIDPKYNYGGTSGIIDRIMGTYVDMGSRQ